MRLLLTIVCLLGASVSALPDRTQIRRRLVRKNPESALEVAERPREQRSHGPRSFTQVVPQVIPQVLPQVFPQALPQANLRTRQHFQPIAMIPELDIQNMTLIQFQRLTTQLQHALEASAQDNNLAIRANKNPVIGLPDGITRQQSQEKQPVIFISNDEEEEGITVIRDDDEKKCLKKIMLIEETVFENKIVCQHSFNEKCHDTFVTDYVSTQEEVCETSFDKKCRIKYRAELFEETVSVCRKHPEKKCGEEYINKDAVQAKQICKQHFETICTTRYKDYTTTQDEPECKEVEKRFCVKKKGDDVETRFFGGVDLDSQGSNNNAVDLSQVAEKDCEQWEDYPVQECQVLKKKRTKVVPETSCEKISRNLCAPYDCQWVYGEEICTDEVESDIQKIPEEECNLEPFESCQLETVLVPELVEHQNCIKVPKEICYDAKVNPTTKKRPVVKEWCYNKSDTKDQETRDLIDQIIRSKEKLAYQVDTTNDPPTLKIE